MFGLVFFIMLVNSVEEVIDFINKGYIIWDFFWLKRNLEIIKKNKFCGGL